jgi:hypothetical protein
VVQSEPSDVVLIVQYESPRHPALVLALVRETVPRFLITVRRPLTALAETQEMSSAITFYCDSSLDTSILASRRAAFLVPDQVLEPAL